MIKVNRNYPYGNLSAMRDRQQANTPRENFTRSQRDGMSNTALERRELSDQRRRLMQDIRDFNVNEFKIEAKKAQDIISEEELAKDLRKADQQRKSRFNLMITSSFLRGDSLDDSLGFAAGMFIGAYIIGGGFGERVSNKDGLTRKERTAKKWQRAVDKWEDRLRNDEGVIAGIGQHTASYYLNYLKSVRDASYRGAKMHVPMSPDTVAMKGLGIMYATLSKLEDPNVDVNRLRADSKEAWQMLEKVAAKDGINSHVLMESIRRMGTSLAGSNEFRLYGNRIKNFNTVSNAWNDFIFNGVDSAQVVANVKSTASGGRRSGSDFGHDGSGGTPPSGPADGGGREAATDSVGVVPVHETSHADGRGLPEAGNDEPEVVDGEPSVNGATESAHDNALVTPDSDLTEVSLDVKECRPSEISAEMAADIASGARTYAGFKLGRGSTYDDVNDMLCQFSGLVSNKPQLDMLPGYYGVEPMDSGNYVDEISDIDGFSEYCDAITDAFSGDAISTDSDGHVVIKPHEIDPDSSFGRVVNDMTRILQDGVDCGALTSESEVRSTILSHMDFAYSDLVEDDIKRDHISEMDDVFHTLGGIVESADDKRAATLSEIRLLSMTLGNSTSIDQQMLEDKASAVGDRLFPENLEAPLVDCGRKLVEEAMLAKCSSDEEYAVYQAYVAGRTTAFIDKARREYNISDEEMEAIWGGEPNPDVPGFAYLSDAEMKSFDAACERYTLFDGSSMGSDFISGMYDTVCAMSLDNRVVLEKTGGPRYDLWFRDEDAQADFVKFGSSYDDFEPGDMASPESLNPSLSEESEVEKADLEDELGLL